MPTTRTRFASLPGVAVPERVPDQSQDVVRGEQVLAVPNSRLHLTEQMIGEDLGSEGELDITTRSLWIFQLHKQLHQSLHRATERTPGQLRSDFLQSRCAQTDVVACSNKLGSSEQYLRLAVQAPDRAEVLVAALRAELPVTTGRPCR